MKLKFSNKSSSLNFKKRIILIPLFVILFVAIGGFVAYQTLDLMNNDLDLSEFKSELDRLATVEQRPIEEDQIAANNSKSPEVKLYGSQLNDRSPFKSLLKKKPEPKPEPEEDSKEKVKPSSAKVKEKDEKTREEIKQEIKSNLQILGILENDSNKVAIIKYGDKASKLVKEGAEVAGLKVKKITTKELVIEDKENEFTYTLGGEED